MSIRHQIAPLIIVTFFSPDQPEIVCVPPGHNVAVPCPKPPGQEVKFTLLQDEEIIYNQTYDRRNALNYKPPYTRAGVELHENADNKSVSFMLTGVNASSRGIYRCESQVMYPPPLRTLSSVLRVLVLVEGKYSREFFKEK